VSGWVRNCPDGTVEVLVAGDSDAVSRVLEAVRQGPPAARVEAVDVRDVAAAEIPPTFTVR
jgi:acylphosphatase